MLILALDTSAAASAALLDDGVVAQRFSSTDTRAHAEVLAPAVQSLLAAAGLAGRDLDAVVAGVGPGPFTGLRAGLVAARTLAFVWDVPLHGVMSLDAIAYDARADGPEGSEFVVATDARRSEVYWARYARRGNDLPSLLDGPHVGTAANVPDLPVYGRGAGLYPEMLAAARGFEAANPDAASIGLVARQALVQGLPLRDTTPLYLRESDAKVPGPRKRATL
ncbi:tRNA (adenosine(37)-N6)-threonylcarbamoyltransferase complex dimerization subunit type 1 TsaB [Arthrobacter sp. Br18]|uniref:tRNA (adenosine(37)-N6)-threonylcarbamoyltransferase complex dimerization subunit type 1 TsaB n=1 Tax=Arthrobacter sp. Br18 TaxID=1312954 RepID=UPI00047A68EC|nr:tRNA (adenosine(37)-N6)-threonylcarbamoyltransferase complex dimerization subunit type 1 TsaB [Arthrobacter sp. Br18]